MIFSQLFSPQYKSSDPEKRIASIEKLNKDTDKDKRILHELAFNDDSDAVSLAALKKLDSFALWMKSIDISPSSRIKKHAQQVCQIQLEDKEKVSDKLFLAYVKESKNKTLLEQLIFSSQRLQSQGQLNVDILFSLNSTNHTRRFFQELASVEQQLSIVAKIEDAKLLSRFAKSAKDGAVLDIIESKLASLALLAQKPGKTKQALLMINSRLLALKESDDFDYLHTHLSALVQEFDALKPDLEYLDGLSQANLSERYLGLKIEVQQKLAKLEDAHKEKLLQTQITQEIHEIQQKCTQVQVQIDLLFDDKDQNAQVSLTPNNANEHTNIDAQVKILTSALGDARAELDILAASAKTTLHTQLIDKLLGNISKQQVQLSHVFELVANSQKAREITQALGHVLSIINEQVQENVSPQDIANMKAQVVVHKEAFARLSSQAKDLLAPSAQKAFANTVSKVNKRIAEFNEHYKQLEKKCESKLKAVNRMVSDGKFKPAIATFHHLQKLYADISGNASLRVQKAYEQTTAEISKLQDWQAYIAQPRKPALLEQAQALVSGKFEDPYARAHSVKELRQQWNSLGQLHTSEDDAQNATFDSLIEIAFAPCRAFFAEIDRHRELNYQKALDIIAQAKAIDRSLNASDLASKMSELKAQFAKLGELDKTQMKQVKRDLAKVFKPLSAEIAKVQQTHAAQKQSLINQAKKLAEDSLTPEMLTESVDKAMALQQKWKLTGFAGKLQDNQLWQAFREANDEIFSRHHTHLNAKKAEQEAQYRVVDEQINEVLSTLKIAKQLSDLQFFDEQQVAIHASARACDESLFKKLQGKLRKMDDLYTEVTLSINSKRDASALRNLFVVLEAYTSAELPEGFDDLPGRYKAWIKSEAQASGLLHGLDRIALTQVAAILLDVPYAKLPIGEQSMRQALQLQMMAAKLQGDSLLEPDSVLAAWAAMGPVKASDRDSLAAMKSLFGV